MRLSVSLLSRHLAQNTISTMLRHKHPGWSTKRSHPHNARHAAARPRGSLEEECGEVRREEDEAPAPAPVPAPGPGPGPPEGPDSPVRGLGLGRISSFVVTSQKKIQQCETAKQERHDM